MRKAPTRKGNTSTARQTAAKSASSAKPLKKPGRKPGKKDLPMAVRHRAFEIYRESRGLATPPAIIKQLKAEGIVKQPIEPRNITNWRKIDNWKDQLGRKAAEASEDVRSALAVIRAPEDFALVERASIRLFAVGAAVAQKLEQSLADIKIQTPAEFEVMARGLSSLMHTQFEVARGLEELRKRRATIFSDGGQEIMPPDRGLDKSAIDSVVENFKAARKEA